MTSVERPTDRAPFIGDLTTVIGSLLTVLGIRLHDPSDGRVQLLRHNGYCRAELGHIIVPTGRHSDGQIHVCPHEGLTDRQLAALLGAAERAFHHHPRKADGWRYTREGNDPRWIAWVSMAVDPAADVAAMDSAQLADEFARVIGTDHSIGQQIAEVA